MSESILIYSVKDSIAHIVLNRPEKRNALNSELCIELGKTWKRFQNDPEARVAVVSGAGKVFCAGADLGGDLTIEALMQILPDNGYEIRKPIVCAVQGDALGVGFSLAIRCCDLTVMGESGNLAYPESKIGTLGGIIEHTAVMPFKVALEFTMTGEPMPSSRAYELGLINKVVKDEDVLEEAFRLARIMAGNAPMVLETLKYCYYKTQNTTRDDYRRDTARLIAPIMASEDFKEGVRALFEKRKPNFVGR
ncbi:MAG: enoyl-CoA hydratase/isomerase family protein [Proteobacteria bacterium]|nr:enoyl-CoA hydratase/isomerase family protein [Pseudomonadota bacterium]